MQPVLPTSFQEFASLVVRQTADLERTQPTRGSPEWYLLNHLQDLRQNVASSSTAAGVANSVKAVGRFVTDSLEWNSALAKGAWLIVEAHGALLQAEKRAP
jgi:hypothetical protein